MSLDPESLLGIKSAVLKAAVAGTLLGVIWRREFTLAQALSSIAAGLGSAMYLAPAVLATPWMQTNLPHDDMRGGFVFSVGLIGTHVFAGITAYGPGLLRKLAVRFLGLDPPKPGGPNPGGGA